MLVPQRLPRGVPRSFLKFNIPRLIVRPVERRVVALQSLFQELIASPVAPALLWQKFLGHLASFVYQVPNCRLLMRPLQLHFLRSFFPLLDPQSKLIPLPQDIKNLCVAWSSPSRLLEGNPFPPPHSLYSSDLRCLLFRLGATPPPPFRISGTWSKEESLLHINSLELRAVFLALMSLEIHVRGQSLLVRSDNTTVVSCIYISTTREELTPLLFVSRQ